MKIYNLFVDGSGFPRGSGWAYILQGIEEKAGYENGNHSNRMEVLAIVKGLSRTIISSQVNIFTDSRAVIIGCKKRNQRGELWAELYRLIDARDITFVKVGKGNKHLLHRHAHNLAREAAIYGIQKKDLSGPEVYGLFA